MLPSYDKAASSVYNFICRISFPPIDFSCYAIFGASESCANCGTIISLPIFCSLRSRFKKSWWRIKERGPSEFEESRAVGDWKSGRSQNGEMHASKTGCWQLVSSLALFASLTVSASANAEPRGGIPANSSNTEVVKSPQRTRRSEYGYPVPEGIEYPWFMPIFGVEMCSKLDGYLCGIGIRVGTKSYFLASVSSVERIKDTLQAYGEVAGPGVFEFNAPEMIDISQPNDGDGSSWSPRFIRMIDHNIGLYQVYVRRLGFILMPETRYPNKVSAPLQTKKGAIKDDCFLLSYGHDQDGGEGIEAPMRYKNYLPVKPDGCMNHSCRMILMPNEDENSEGFYCGVYSELGAPIVCGYGPEETVDYIVTEARKNRESNCGVDSLMVLEVSGYGQEIIDQVANWEKDDDERFNKQHILEWGR
jgi:hypothetical protein